LDGWRSDAHGRVGGGVALRCQIDGDARRQGDSRNLIDLVTGAAAEHLILTGVYCVTQRRQHTASPCYRIPNTTPADGGGAFNQEDDERLCTVISIAGMPYRRLQRDTKLLASTNNWN